MLFFYFIIKSVCFTDCSANDEPTGVDEMGKLVTVGITLAVIAFFITIALIVFVLVARVILKIRHKKDTNPLSAVPLGE